MENSVGKDAQSSPTTPPPSKTPATALRRAARRGWIKTNCVSAAGPDIVFRLVGTSGGGGATATPTPCVPDAITNGGFETGSFAPWVVLDTSPAPAVSSAQAHTGTFSAFLGSPVGGETPGNSSIYQTITVPAGGGTLSYWYYPNRRTPYPSTGKTHT